MPQMAPISWLSLYLIFTITLILFCVMVYYMFIPSSPKKLMSKTLLSSPLNWKW